MKPISNEPGWRLSVDGNWYSPYVEVDGRWVERTDIEWATEEPSSPAPKPKNEKSVKDMHEETVQKTKTLTDFVDKGLSIQITQPPHIDTDSGMVCVHVKAKFMGKVVDTDDGRFQFHGLPVGDPPTLKTALAEAIRRHNGIEVG